MASVTTPPLSTDPEGYLHRVRPYLKAAIAFAAAGIMVAVPAFAPSLSPNDTRVARDATVAPTANDYQSIINTFFGKYSGSTDAPGPWGRSGGAHQ